MILTRLQTCTSIILISNYLNNRDLQPQRKVHPKQIRNKTRERLVRRVDSPKDIDRYEGEYNKAQ